ncbi:MAG: hypothetical protein MZV70_66640 [Desulfobacterales bacterium]|nr:hypothetical protein [Desulfobacterales bacterium]
MKICIVGLPQSGKSSLFSALTGLGTESASAKGADPVAVVKVPDPRLEKLADHLRAQEEDRRGDRVRRAPGPVRRGPQARPPSASSSWASCGPPTPSWPSSARSAILRSPTPWTRSTPGATWPSSRRSSS